MKNMIENMLKSELEEHIETQGNTSKNGIYKKSVRSDSGKLDLNIPRDRNSNYKPQIIPKGETTISGIDDKIISMYARGMSLRDIEKQVREMHGVEMSDREALSHKLCKSGLKIFLCLCGNLLKFMVFRPHTGLMWNSVKVTKKNKTEGKKKK